MKMGFSLIWKRHFCILDVRLIDLVCHALARLRVMIGTFWKGRPSGTIATFPLSLLALKCLNADVHTSRASGTAVPKSTKDKASNVMLVRFHFLTLDVREDVCYEITSALVKTAKVLNGCRQSGKKAMLKWRPQGLQKTGGKVRCSLFLKNYYGTLLFSTFSSKRLPPTQCWQA